LKRYLLDNLFKILMDQPFITFILKGIPMLTRTARHALNVVTLVAAQASTTSLTTKRMSEELGLSVSYLEGILKELKSAGVLCAFKGPGGGYQLNQDPRFLNVWEVLSVFVKTPWVPESARTSEDLGVAELEAAFLEQSVEFLKSKKIAEFAGQLSNGALTSSAKAAGRFKLKPLPPPLKPASPNSVFQLHSFPASLFAMNA